MHYSQKIREEELKNRVAADFFHKYDCTGIIKDIDFAVKIGASYLLWAEAKKSATDIIAMLAQLVLTIGKARTFNEVLPPKFLGCFDCEKDEKNLKLFIHFIYYLVYMSNHYHRPASRSPCRFRAKLPAKIPYTKAEG